MDALKGLGFTTCFYVGGGNSMHLLESASHRFNCIPVVHEVTAAIAAEYFNESNLDKGRAFALVTAGPGLTNLLTGIAGAWLDSRELLVVGGQAKSSNLANGTVRQLGHQEIDGKQIVSSITKQSIRVESPVKEDDLREVISSSWTDRPGPTFIEVCLDVSAMEVDWGNETAAGNTWMTKDKSKEIDHTIFTQLRDVLEKSRRPLILLGGGVERGLAKLFLEKVEQFRIPVACTWTGADRVGSDYPFYAGRPNTYGMRWSNIFQQQADLLIAVGTSLGFQQTGFNVDAFLPNGLLVHVDIDINELSKEYPKARYSINADSHNFLNELLDLLNICQVDTTEWVEFLRVVKSELPTLEDCQKSRAPFVSPHEVMHRVKKYMDESDCYVAASSGGTFTASMQSIDVRGNQTLIGNKGLASMGYGLAGAIGCALSRPNSKVVLFEGDGGFAQNMQDLGTVAAQNLNIKVFITCNDGYASIRTSQKNYFGGHYLGCDSSTGLLLPNWRMLANAYGLKAIDITGDEWEDAEFREAMDSKGPAIFLIQSDPEQFYLPKIFSKVDAKGRMTSTALHNMSPQLDVSVMQKVFRYIESPEQ
jgi:acetolactate synthase-1/2/3 large subunit